MNGKILADDDPLLDTIPVHPNCKCIIERLLGVLAGTVTNEEERGVEVFFINHGYLPTHYIPSEEAIMRGWNKLEGNLAEVLPGRVIGGDIFQNRKKKLPVKIAVSGMRRTLITQEDTETSVDCFTLMMDCCL